MKIKNIKLIIFVVVLILIFSLFIFFTFKKYNYKKEYKVNEYKIIESFNKKTGYYNFSVKRNNITYEFLIKNKYSRKRELIGEIKTYFNEDEICILPLSKYVEFYPLCSNKDSIFTYNLSTIKDLTYNYEKIEKINKEIYNININNFNNASFLLYNYKGFYLINENKVKEIELFNKDVYTINLVYQMDNYLLIPDYNESYYFNKIYIINILNGKVKEIKFEYDIYFDSLFLGHYKNNIYLLDKKEEKEYMINIKKEKIEKIEFQTFKNDKLVKTDFKDIVKNNLIFPTNNIYKYEIVDETLYLIINNTKIKLSNRKVDKIIENAEDTVYYLSNENLYMYNNKYGEILLMSNFEWNFNNTNIIYLYK